jgi:sugar lactone lactonase YvrE
MVAHMELTTVASSGNVMVTNAAVSPRGRLFGNFPRWTDVPTPSVGEATVDGSFRPFPGGDWNEWRPGLSPRERFVCTHGLHADRDNNLWVIDDASPHHGKMVEGGAKLVQIDLETNRVRRIYALGPDLAPPGAVLSHLRVDARFLYVTDSGFGLIVVIDRTSGRGHRVLEGAPCSRADRSITPVIHGKPMTHPDGRVPVINLSHLELSPNGAWMYFTPLFGPTLWRVETRYLKDPALAREAAAHVEAVVAIPPVTGITSDAAGTLYFSALTEDGVLKMGADRKLQTVIRDARISGPNEGSIGPDGCYYFPNSQAPRVNRPYEVFRISLS